jgi:predicted nucleotidyltransferase
VSLIDAVARAINAIEESGHRCCLVGGLAVSARVEPRFTRDADLAVTVDNDADAEALIVTLRSTGYSVGLVTEQEATGRLATVRVFDADGTVIDLLFASSGIEDLIVRGAERVEIVAGLRVPTARVGHLIAMKLLSNAPGRETDIMDLRNLADVATSDDWTDAELAVATITDRGSNRDRNLGAALATLRNEIN